MIILYILLGVVSVILLLLFIALVNSFIIKIDNKINVSPEIDKDLSTVYAKEFSKMIKVKTISYDKEKKNLKPFLDMHEIMKEIFPNVYKVWSKLFLKEDQSFLNGLGNQVRNQSF